MEGLNRKGAKKTQKGACISLRLCAFAVNAFYYY